MSELDRDGLRPPSGARSYEARLDIVIVICGVPVSPWWHRLLRALQIREHHSVCSAHSTRLQNTTKNRNLYAKMDAQLSAFTSNNFLARWP